VVDTLLFNPKDDLENIKILLGLARKRDAEVIEINESEVKALSDTVHSQGVFCVVRQKQFDIEFLMQKKPNFIVMVEAGQDPGNLGTLIRTCDWFGVDAIILSTGNVDLYNPKVLRATMGSIFHVPIIENINLHLFLSEIKKMGYHVFAADVGGGLPYFQAEFIKPVALILGNENRGISKENLQLVDKTICIPAFGKAESLNLASAAAVLIGHIRLKLSA
jgi:TrmH family RNA methyltransferase